MKHVFHPEAEFVRVVEYYENIGLAVVGILSGFTAFGVGDNVLWAIGSFFLINREPGGLFLRIARKKALDPRVRKDDRKGLFSYQSPMQACDLHTKR